MPRFRGYFAFFDKALQAHLAYAPALLLNLSAGAVGYLITVMIWSYALPNPAESQAMFAYLTLCFMLNYILNLFLERSIGERIREGLVATDLLKPVDFQVFHFVQSLSDMLFQSLIALVVFGLGLLILGRALLPASPLALGAFALSLGLAFLVQFGLCFLFVQGAFVTNTNYGIISTRMALHQAFSGVFAPLAFYPPFLRNVASCLPFGQIVYTPVAIYLGRIPETGLSQALLIQAAWALGLILLGRLVFRRVLSSLAIQGG